MAQQQAPKTDILRFKGCAQFRQRIVFATLAHKKLRIDNIRDKDEAPGLRDFEASFLRLIEKITNGCRIEINETGTSLKYAPGWIVGGSIEHDCGTGRSIGWFLEGLLPLAPFGKKALMATLSGITNDDTDLSVDVLKTIHLPTLTHFGVSEGLKLDILARGCPPQGGGRVSFTCPVLRELKPISLTDEGFIKRIRGLAYSCRYRHRWPTGSWTPHGVINPLLADVYVYTDHKKGDEGGASPGYGVSLIAVSTSGCVYGAQKCTGAARGLTDPLGDGSGTASPPLPPEDVGKAAAESLMEQIAAGGCIDDHVQPLVFVMMLLCTEDVSRVRIGRLSPAGIATLRLIRDVWGVAFKLKTETQREAPAAPTAKRRKRSGDEEDEGEGDDDDGVADAGRRDKSRRKQKAEEEAAAIAQAPLTAEAGGGYAASSSVLVSCLGIGFKNFAKKAYSTAAGNHWRQYPNATTRMPASGPRSRQGHAHGDASVAAGPTTGRHRHGHG